MPSMKYKKLQLEEIKIMDVLERNVMRECNTLLVDNLDAKDIAPFLYSKQFLNENQMEEIFNNKCIRRNICQMFLLMVVKTCPFKVFLFALRLYNQYSFLADKLEECVSKRRAFKQQHGRETEIVEVKCDKEETVQSITKQVDKISISSSHKRKIAIIAHKLKTLSHDGKTEKLKKHTQIILDNFKLKKVSGCFKRPVTKQMELADLAFTALEAEVIARRVKYDVTLYGSKVYDEMKSLIPFTTNPTTSSMTFLSRYGSSLTMLEPLDVGLQYLEIAKQHAIFVEPGQETGMVYYIEGNLLTQKYEKDPTDTLKDEVIKTAEYAISQFENEAQAIRLDYQRMLMLKMVFCYLGLGLFCKTIPNVIVSKIDLQKAKKLLDFVGRPDVWDGMEVRRKMLYHVAMAELSRRGQNKELARCHATEAQKIAQEFDWRTELPNICLLLEDIENVCAVQCDDTDKDVKAVNELLSEILQGCGEA